MDPENKYFETYSFFAGLFGDYWEGKKEEDIIQVAISQDDLNWLPTIVPNIEDMLNDKNVDYIEFLNECNIHSNTNEEAKSWIELVKNILKDKLSLASKS